MKTGKSYPPKLQTYMVCYGIKGLQADVPSNIYDALWGVDNGKVTFNETIDMGNNKITGVSNGIADSDVVNKSQLDALETKNKYYYYTDDLKDNNEGTIKFPRNVSQYPFFTSKYSPYKRIKIELSGYYHIIYTDFYTGGGRFQILHDSWEGLDNPDPIFTLSLDVRSNRTPIKINVIKKIETLSGANDARIIFTTTSGNLILDGVGHSTFYIKYLHP